MAKFRLQASIGLALFAALYLAAAPAAQADLRDLLPFGRSHRISRLLPVVVAITIHKVATPNPGEAPSAEPQRTEAFGAGFIIDASGYIGTNKHVIEDALDITVTLQDGTAMPARLIGTGSQIDLALLKVTPSKPLPTVKWGDSNHVHVGDQVLVIGNPLGIGETVSAGIVSALNRNIMLGPYDDFIQTDAAINHGNSGGPLFDTRGEVIGVNTALITPDAAGGSIGLGFAIPSNDARFVLEQLQRYGRARPGWLGALTQDVTPDIADALGLPQPRGIIIADLDKDSPADRAALQQGDVILKFGEQTPRDVRALARLVAQSAGDTVPLAVWRDGREQALSISVTEKVQEAKAAPAKPAAVSVPSAPQPPDLGLHTAQLTDEARTRLRLAAAQAGVVVTGIVPNTAAADRGIAPGDVVLRVQQWPVSSSAEVQQRLDEARQQNRRHVLLLVQGKDGPRWVALPLGG